MTQSKGLIAEQQAQAYLISQGLTWVESNYRARLGEIDLIMREGDVLVFVEVRKRSSSAYGGAMASVTPSKKHKVMKTASYYLTVNKLHDKHAVRFDVVGLDGTPPTMAWIKNAFGMDY
jgi:putative endonuclease